jgi:hypothetical protein
MSHAAPQPKKPSTATAVPSSKTPANSWPAICVLPHRRYFRSEAQIPVATTRTSSPSPSGSSTSTTSTEGGALRAQQPWQGVEVAASRAQARR